MIHTKIIPLTALLFFLQQAVSAETNPIHDEWNSLLKTHVAVIDKGKKNTLNYASMASDRKHLKTYLKNLANISQEEFDSWSRDDQLAFLINAYNAWTVEYILTAWPDIKSIKDLGNFLSSPWSKKFVYLLGDKRSLDNIEQELIRGSENYREPRIHFAVNCASIGCPALRAEAYIGEQLNQQLEEQTRLFLSDRDRNRVTEGVIELSSIFKWYRDDFEKGWQGYASLEQFLLNYSAALEIPEAQKRQLESREAEIKFLSYDWKLNNTP